jgi:hypothetical protein
MMTEVKGTRNDVFHLYELYLMAEATGNDTIFGLPDKSVYAITDPHYLDAAKEAIQEKGILNEEGHISDGGFFVIKAIQEYATSRKYVQINNLMIAFSESEPDELIVLTEIENQSYYQIKVMDKILVLKDLFDSVAIVQREPLADEKEFTLKKLRNRERRSILEEEIEENVLSLAVFDTETVQTDTKFAQWLYFMEEDKLCTVNVEEEAYYRVSQYWLMKELFDSLEIPYPQETEEK